MTIAHCEITTNNLGTYLLAIESNRGKIYSFCKDLQRAYSSNVK